MSNMTTTKPIAGPRSRYRWVVMTIIFFVCAVNLADRTNIGVALPFISKEFGLSNFEAGTLAGTFFLGYAISQIPAGFWCGKYGTRGLVSLAILGFSLFTWLIGTASSALGIKIFRFGLGITEGPIPVGLTSTVNNWFPPREKATATGIYIAATMFAPIIVPPLCVWIAVEYGWRWIFFSFAIPGILMALIWHKYVRSKPEDSKYISATELAYIRGEDQTTQAKAHKPAPLSRWFKMKVIDPISTNRQVFCSWNIWGNCLAYFMMVSVLYGLLTWIPSYLVNEKGFSFIKMGLIASSPWIGGLVGCVFGGWLSDRIRQRKPMMLLTALSTAIMMVVLISIPNNIPAVASSLFLVGFLINVGWPSFTAYPMGLTTNTTYPVAISLINSCGNLGGFFAPIIAGLLLDKFVTYNSVFIYFGSAALLGFLIILTLDEPIA
ncbi:MFS transporter [Brenneria corticis]|uniref:MFS transporter n=1 Tax=Brenneria corticis TaxID=2173106 RepID=A0A2U1U7L5_9GAMM|nr:MFS transporter [Brenneria sp. CFCC 11842]PWC17653.1 MFS transporter [Brenneria sp. CFCC 11842]